MLEQTAILFFKGKLPHNYEELIKGMARVHNIEVMNISLSPGKVIIDLRDTMETAIAGKFIQAVTEFEKELNQSILQGSMVHQPASGDQYHIHGQAAAVGPGASAVGNTFNQIQIPPQQQEQMINELKVVREALKKQATSDEDYVELGNVSEAIIALENNDSDKAVSSFRKLAKRTTDFIQNLGVAVTAEFIKHQIYGT